MQLIGRTHSWKLPALVALVLGGGCSDPESVPVATTIEISPPAPVLGEFGDTVRLTAIVRDQNEEAMPWVPVTWTGIGMFVADVSGDGLVTANEPGRVRVRASAETITADVDVLVQPGPRAVLHKFYRRMGGDDWVRNTGWKSNAELNRWIGVSTHVDGSIGALVLANNGLTGTIPHEVGSLTTLLTLWLSGNDVTGEIPHELGNLGNLLALNLTSNDLEGEIPPQLGSLDSLRSLNLGLNKLTGSIPAELGNLSSLSGLNLESNQLTGPVPGELGNISPLVVLDIAHNPLSGTLPRELMQLRRLALFHWDNTDLCAPVDIEFQDWLNSIPSQRGNRGC